MPALPRDSNGEAIQNSVLNTDGSVSQVGRGNPMPVGTSLVSAVAEFQRPADTTSYSTYDAIGTVNEFTLTAVGRLIKARLITDNAAIIPSTRLMLYTSSALAGGPPVDNAPMPLRWDNRLIRVGHIDFPNLNTLGTGSDSSAALADYISLPFICAPGSTKLYGVLVAMTSFVPTSGQRFCVELTASVEA